MKKTADFGSLVGKILIASPNAKDDGFFKRSLVYVFMHNKDGAYGVVLNQKTEDIYKGQLSDICSQTDKDNRAMLSSFYKKFSKRNIPIMLGGPVNTQYYIALSIPDNCARCCEDSSLVTLYLNIELFVEDYLEKGRISDFMLIRGMSIWEAGQIEDEIAKSNWFISDLDLRTMFSQKNENRWDYCTRELGITQELFVAPYSGNA